MIVNLIGPQGVGKSTFARWFIARNKGWEHCDIAANRIEAVGRLCSPTISATERYAWKKLRRQCTRNRNCIVESTGLDSRIDTIWTPELIRKGIYTVKLEASIDRCKERCIKRNEILLEGYDVDECYALELEQELQAGVPATIVAYVEEENVEKVHEAIEQCILHTAALFKERQIVI